MVNYANLSLMHVHQSNISSQYQDFVVDLSPSLLLQIMRSYDLKSADISGEYTFDIATVNQLIETSAFINANSALNTLLAGMKQWPKQLSWLQFNQHINDMLIAWLSDYKAGADLDAAFFLARNLHLKSSKSAGFQSLLMHLLARTTNQLDQYKFNYIQNFDLETGLPNQKLMLRMLEQNLHWDTKTLQFSSAHLGLILINLNINFEEASQLNAASSDLVLAAIQIIQQHLSDDATLFHVGPSELAIMVGNLNFPAQLNLITSKLSHAFESELPLENTTLILKPFFGAISTFNSQTNALAMHEHARLTLHHAILKNEQVKIYDQHITSSFMNTHLLDEAIIEALQQNELAIYLQPIVSIPHEICGSVEVLLRWPSQQWQTISPVKLIDTIYKKGFGKVFIRWLINSACRQCAELITLYQRKISLTINLCGKDLLDADLPELLAQAITLWDIPAECLVIEITESDLLIDETLAMQIIDKFILLGCKLALDDFGTGYSSMARLRNMPIDFVKIDQSFVRNIASSKEDRAIVQSVVKLAHSLGKAVIAEGVEDLDCLNILQEMKCEKIQGYYYAKPMSCDDFIIWLDKFEASKQALSH
jgi:diguanylate cyclase